MSALIMLFTGQDGKRVAIDMNVVIGLVESQTDPVEDVDGKPERPLPMTQVFTKTALFWVTDDYDDVLNAWMGAESTTDQLGLFA